MEEKLIRNENEAIEAIKSNMPTSGYYMLREALDMAISVLEKQIPKKPRFDHMIGNTKGKFQCDCGHWIIHDCYELNDVPYCEKCGQKLNWSDDN